ncbi:MAG: hypothetical protein KY432_03230 [Acidobacteria bacterium]|nr:hypothetical protein [Acidobacteriota bacterium]
MAADTAEANSDRSALLITGFEQSERERINLSLLNFGEGLARAFVKMLDRNGEVLGNAYLATVEEENTFLIIDLAAAVGADPAPDGAIRIDVESGVIGSQLSIVDGATGSADVVTAVPVQK